MSEQVDKWASDQVLIWAKEQVLTWANKHAFIWQIKKALTWVNGPLVDDTDEHLWTSCACKFYDGEVFVHCYAIIGEHQHTI